MSMCTVTECSLAQSKCSVRGEGGVGGGEGDGGMQLWFRMESAPWTAHRSPRPQRNPTSCPALLSPQSSGADNSLTTCFLGEKLILEIQTQGISKQTRPTFLICGRMKKGSL